MPFRTIFALIGHRQLNVGIRRKIADKNSQNDTFASKAMEDQNKAFKFQEISRKKCFLFN
jgi:hypothetical protein